MNVLSTISGWNLFAFFDLFIVFPLLLVVPVVYYIFVKIDGGSLQLLPVHGRRRLHPLICALLAFLVGCIATFVWLGWDTTHGFDAVANYGLDADQALWQFIGCVLTLVILSPLVWSWCRHPFYGAWVVGLLMAAGVALMVAVAASIGEVNRDDGKTVLMVQVLGGLALVLVNYVFATVGKRTK